MDHRALFFSSIKLRKLLLRKTHHAIHMRMQRGIFPGVGVSPGTKFGAPLSNDDAAGADFLAAKELYAQALAFTVMHVGGGASSLFMRHRCRISFSRGSSSTKY